MDIHPPRQGLHTVAPFLDDIDIHAILPPSNAEWNSRPSTTPTSPFKRGSLSQVTLDDSRRSGGGGSTFMPSLAGLARTISKSSLGNITLKNILDGETCDPIGFSDFEAFLTHKEFSTENLLFIVWFRSYTERFFALSEEEKSKVAPAPNAKPFSHSIANDHQKPANGTVNLEDVAGPKITKQRQFRVCEWTQEGGAPSTSGVQFQPRVHVPDEVVSSPSMVLNSVTPDDRIEFEPNLLAPAASPSIDNGHFFDLVAPGLNNLVRRSSIALIFGSTPDPIHPPPRPRLSPHKPCEQLSYTTLVEPRLQPMREEAQRAFATFLRKGGSRELNVNEDVRDACARALGSGTHPQLFRPIYEEIYAHVERQSLPNFLSYAQSNVNLPNQLFWYAVGFGDLSVSLIIFLVLTFKLKPHPYGLRAWRLFSLFFSALGAMQMYSAWRGFCSQVWSRASRQLHPWEMDEDIEGVRVIVTAERLRSSLVELEKLPDSNSYSRAEENSDGGSATSFGVSSSSVAPIFESQGLSYQRQDGRTGSLTGTRTSGEAFPIDHRPTPNEIAGANPASPTKQLMEGFRYMRNWKSAGKYSTPKIFGPERVVLDERIIRLHRMVMRDILVVGAFWAVLWTVLCLAVPTMG